MDNKKLKIARALVWISLIPGILTWAYHAYFFVGTPEEEAWAPIAGIFMGVTVGVVCFVIALINLFVVRKKGRS